MCNSCNSCGCRGGNNSDVLLNTLQNLFDTSSWNRCCSCSCRCRCNRCGSGNGGNNGNGCGCNSCGCRGGNNGINSLSGFAPIGNGWNGNGWSGGNGCGCNSCGGGCNSCGCRGGNNGGCGCGNNGNNSFNTSNFDWYYFRQYGLQLHIQRQVQRPSHFQLPCNMMALAAHMPESVCDAWGHECVGEWQYSNWPAGVFQCQNHSTWLIHFTYHQLVEQI